MSSPKPAAKPSSLLDTRVIYCGDNLDQLSRLPDACVDLIYIDPPFNSNRNYEVFWGETREKRAFEEPESCCCEISTGPDSKSSLRNVSREKETPPRRGASAQRYYRWGGKLHWEYNPSPHSCQAQHSFHPNAVWIGFL